MDTPNKETIPEISDIMDSLNMNIFDMFPGGLTDSKAIQEGLKEQFNDIVPDSEEYFPFFLYLSLQLYHVTNLDPQKENIYQNVLTIAATDLKKAIENGEI